MDDAWSNVIPERSSFFGRREEQDSLLALLRGGARLVTISGPSGMGKTRLARKVASLAGPGFAEHGGIWFCSLVGCSSAADVHAVVARTLEIPQQQAGSLSTALAELGPLLLVLDNLEHLVHEARPLVEEWLDHCPELQILGTSLVPLELSGEVRFELGPLEEDDAIALYLDRARSAWADRSFPSSEEPVIEELVRRLDRLPLAIELAAARVRILPPRQLLTRIEERLDLLQREGEGRHGSLMGAISLSWNLLGPEEQRLLARASAFVGGFTLEAAEEVLAVEGGRTKVHEILKGLRDKALLQLEEGEGAPRFFLYESVHAFASVRLEEIGEREPAYAAHADYYLRQARHHADRSAGPDTVESMQWLVAERENLVAVHRRSRDSDPAAAVQVGLALAGILAQQGPPASEDEILDHTVAAARRQPDPSLLASALWVRARSRKREGRHDEAKLDIEEGLRAARAAGDRAREGYLLAEAGGVHVHLNEIDEAEVEIEAALAIGREVGDHVLIGLALLILGAIEESRGNLERSRAFMESSLATLRQRGHLRYQCVALLNLGALSSHQGRFSAARQALNEARDICERLANRSSGSYVYANLGSVALASGALDEAEEHFMTTLRLEKRVGNRQLRAIAIGGLGLSALARGQAREAEQKLAEAVALLREIGVERHVATHLPFRAATLSLLGRIEEARLDLEEARTYFEAMEDGKSLRMLALLEGIVELSEARTLAMGGREPEALALEDRVRARLEEARQTQGETVVGFFLARRLLGDALRRKDCPTAPLFGSPPPPARAGLTVGPGTAWFTVDENERVDLRRRTAIRLIFRGLVEQRLISPGVGLSQKELAAIGWPGERILPNAAATRVWSGIRTLRSLGLAEILLRHADGYLLDPQVPIVRATEGAEPDDATLSGTG